MKKILTILAISLIFVSSGRAQDNDEAIVLKGDYILIDIKCTTAFRNSQPISQEYVEVDKVFLKRSSVLSAIKYNNQVVISTSELTLSNNISANKSKHYSFDFVDTNSANRFYLNLMDKLSSD